MGSFIEGADDRYGWRKSLATDSRALCACERTRSAQSPTSEKCQADIAMFPGVSQAALPAQALVTTGRLGDVISGIRRVQKLRQVPCHGPSATLEDRDGLPDLRDGLFRRWRVDHDDVGRIAHLDAVIPEIENAR